MSLAAFYYKWIIDDESRKSLTIMDTVPLVPHLVAYCRLEIGLTIEFENEWRQLSLLILLSRKINIKKYTVVLRNTANSIVI